MAHNYAGHRRANDRAGEHGMSLIEAIVVVVVTSLLALILLPLASRASRRDYDLADRALESAAIVRGERLFRELLAAASPTPDPTLAAVAASDASALSADSALIEEGAAAQRFAVGERATNASRQAFAAVRDRPTHPRPSATPAILGSALEVTLRPALAQPLACAPAGVGAAVRLRIEADRLVCETTGTRETVLSWRAGRARLTYSASIADSGGGPEAWLDVWAPEEGSTMPDPSAAPIVRFELDADGRHVVWIAPAGAADGGAPVGGETR